VDILSLNISINKYLNGIIMENLNLKTPLKTDEFDFSVFRFEPEWAADNPYLNILSPRFFSDKNKIDWSDLPIRVGKMFYKAERKHIDDSIALDNALEITRLVSEGAFLPNSPVMMNSESDTNVNLFACHVLSPPSNMNDLDVAKKIHDGCGGIGYDFSNMDDPISATLSIETQTELLNPNRKRKAHSAVTLPHTHPKIVDFIGLSSKLTITHTNIEFHNNFFTEINNKNLQSTNLWNTLCDSIYNTGRPSLSFSCEKAKRSNSKLINNVCGESLLRENESSLIGSLNLTKFVEDEKFNFNRFKEAARLGLRCLDNLHDIQDHASKLVQDRCLESRKVGVGIMGYSDALLLLNIRYGSEESFIFIDKLMSLLKKTLTNESEKLGKERGYCKESLLIEGTKPRRNASLMAIPANGTLSLIANVCGGIEPAFTYLIKQKIQDEYIYQLQPTFKSILNHHDIDTDFIFNELMSGKDIQSITELKQSFRNILVVANDLTTEEHVLTQAKFQKFIDGGISKTINLPNSATIDDIKNAILLAKNKGCVGISLYRNGSLQNQPTQSVN